MYHQNNMRITSEYTPLEAENQRTKEFLLALHQAVNNDELSINYQPRYDSVTGQTNVFEALIRWNHKGVGSIIPGKIIDNAIQFGLIYDLDLWVFERCCRDLLRLHLAVDKNIKIVINISLEAGGATHPGNMYALRCVKGYSVVRRSR